MKSVILVWLFLLSAEVGFGQGQTIGSFPNFEGGFETFSSGTLTALSTYNSGTQYNSYYLSTTSSNSGSISTTTPRTGSKILVWGTSGASKSLYSTTVNTSGSIQNNTSYVVQFYYATSKTNALGSIPTVSISPDGTGSPGTAVSTGIASTASATTWTKKAIVINSGTSIAATKYGTMLFKADNFSNTNLIYFDDLCVYPGSATDNTAPGNPGVMSVAATGTSGQLFVSWGASPDIDGGGYIVVRSTSDPTTTPNPNGIYGVGNNLGTGSVVYIGTGTSFTDIGLTDGTTYYYRVYTCDKAFNYSSPSLANGIPSAGTPDVILSSEDPSVPSSNVVQGSFKNIIYKFQLDVNTATATLNTVTFNTGGSYSATDVSKFQLWYKNNDDIAGATLIGSDITTSLGTGTHSFSGISKAISPNTTEYYWITADITTSALPGSTINVPALITNNISFTTANKSGVAHNGDNQIITSPDIIISTANPAVSGNSVYAGTTDLNIYSFTLTPTLSTTLSEVSFTTSGTYLSTDIVRYQLFYSSINDLNTATQIGADISSTLGTGTHSFSGLSNSISAGIAGYYWITTDISGSAGSNRTIYISALSSENFTVSTGNVGCITTYAAGTQILLSAVSTATDHFRTKQSGTWSTAGNWESSSTGGAPWVTATLAPSYYSASILVSHYMTTNTSGFTVDNVTIDNGGTWEQLNNASIINDGTGSDVIIKSGGILKWGANSSMPTLNGTIEVQSGGMIEVVGNYSNTWAFGNNVKVIWNDGAIFNINNTGGGSSFPFDGKTFFPNAAPGTTPILRITKLSSVGSGSNDTYVNGKFEFSSSSDISFGGSPSHRYIRDGIIGNGTGKLIIGSGSLWHITGQNAVLGGSNVIQTNSNGGNLVIDANSVTTLITNKTVNNNSGSGDFIVLLDGTLVCGTNVISGSANFSLNAGGTIKTSHLDGLGDRTLSPAKGSIQNTGATRSFSSAANYEYNNTTTAQNSGTGLPDTVNDLTINNGANPSSTNGVTLNNTSGTVVNGVLYLKDGIVTTTASLPITVNNTATTAVNRTITADETYVNGPIRRYLFSGTTAEYLFPTGKNSGNVSRYKPVTFIPVSNAGGRFDAEYFYSNPPSQGVTDFFAGSLMGIDKLEFWQFDRASGSTTGKLRIPYVNPGTNNWRDAAGYAINPCSNCNVAVVKRTTSSGNGNWDFTAANNNFNSSVPEYRWYGDQGDITSQTINSFSPFTFGFSYNVILPVKLTSFTGKLQDHIAVLHWTIADNQDLAGFELQHSRDGRSFSRLVDIVPGTTNSYDYRHVSLATGSHFYRLLVKEKSGNTFYSNIVLLTIGKPRTQVIGLRENPVYNQLTVQVLSATGQLAYAQVTDGLGRNILNVQYPLQAGHNQWPVHIPTIARGMYFLQVTTTDGEKATMRFVKE